jgi:hypothetical protein
MANMKTFLNMFCFSLFLIASVLNADNRINSFQFLNAVYSPRLAALGGGFSSLSGDISSVYINPAGLAWNDRTEIVFTYGDYLLDLKGGWLGASYPLNDQIHFGSSITYFDYGSFKRVDRFGSLTGDDFVARDAALSISAAGTIQRVFAWGVTAKYVYSEIDQFHATAAAADIGILFRSEFLDNLTAGLAVRNIGRSLDAYYQEKESLPASISFSLSKRINPYPVSIHAGWNDLWPGNRWVNNKLRNFSAGLEIAALEQLTVRLGYNNQRMNDLEGSGFHGISGGFGLRLGIHQFDYGYANYGDAGMTHHFGLTFRFGATGERETLKESSLIGDLYDAYSVRDVRFSVNRDILTIYWKPVRGTLYNVYVRLNENPEWALINKVPQEQNYLELRAPRTKGTYIFRIALVIDGKERYFSKEFELKI